MTAIQITVGAALALLFLLAAVSKLTGSASSIAMRSHLGIPAANWKLIGSLELAGAGGVLSGFAWNPLGAAASAGLAILSIGAVATHLRTRDPISAAAPAVVGLVLASSASVLFLT